MAAERDFLIRSDDCELSELASMIKKIVETTQDSEYPNFKLLPCVYDLGEEKNDKFLLLWGEYTGSLDEMIRLLPKGITVEWRGGTFDLDSQLKTQARINYKSVDTLIQQLQIEERKEEKSMEKNKENTEVTENEQRAGEKGEHKIYLTLPPIRSKAKKKKMISNLKEAGAKFDSYNKHWYITPDADFNQFKGFLGLPYEYVNERGKELRARENEKKNKEGRDSVKDKLDRNKDAVEKNSHEKKEPEHNREEAR